MPKKLEKVRHVFHFSDGKISHGKWYYEEDFGKHYWTIFCLHFTKEVIQSNNRVSTGAYSELEYIKYIKYSWWDKLLIAVFKVNPEKLMGDK